MQSDGWEMNGAINGTQTTLASAATVNIGAAKANSILITGTTNISAFDTIQAGTIRYLTFAGELDLVNSSGLVLPTGANITTAANDVAIMKSLGSGNWQCIVYQLASGAALVSGVSPNTQLLIDTTHDDLIGLFAGNDINPKACYRITDAAPGVLRVYGATTSTITGVAFLEGSDDNNTLTNGSWGNYDITTDKFFPLTSYLTLDLTAWNALVAANGLVAGWQYLVTGAFTSPLYGVDWDILVTAISTNDIQSTGYVTNYVLYIPCDTDAGFNGANLSFGGIPLAVTATQILGGISNYTQGAPIFIQSGSPTKYFATRVSDDPATLCLNNVQAFSPADAGEWSIGDFGTYDPNTDTFTPNASPSFTPANVVESGDITATALNANYVVVNNMCIVNIQLNAETFTYSTGQWNYQFDFPVPSIATLSNDNVYGVVMMKNGGEAVNLINSFVYTDSNQIAMQIKFTALFAGPGYVYATINYPLS